MNYNELKEHGGYITLDPHGRVMRYTTHPLPVSPSKEMLRIAAELVFHVPDDSKANVEVGDSNMDTALKAGIKYADRGYCVDIVRGEFLDLETDYIEPAAFISVWRNVKQAVPEDCDRLRADIDEIGGDDSADLPHIDSYQFPSFWRPAREMTA